MFLYANYYPMNITIRKATEDDFKAILDLVNGLAVFQNSAHLVTNSVDQMKEEKEFFNAFVADGGDGEIVGVATYFFAYYTWAGKSLYLDDLFVREDKRGLKIGSALLRRLFDTAKAENCKRVRWLVSKWNTQAINFYMRCGASIDSECMVCDFDINAIHAFNLDI